MIFFFIEAAKDGEERKPAGIHLFHIFSSLSTNTIDAKHRQLITQACYKICTCIVLNKTYYANYPLFPSATKSLADNGNCAETHFCCV